jgi:deoxyribodipyrimidine photo-lyase
MPEHALPIEGPAILWFRSDLRLGDNPALAAAAAGGRPVVPVFVLDDDAAGAWRIGGASRWWLHHSLVSLALDLGRRGLPLVLRRGDTVQHLVDIARATEARSLHFSRAYEPAARDLEARVHQALGADGLDVKRYAGSLLFEPDQVRTKTDGPYRVYTPFWRSVSGGPPPRQPRPAPAALRAANKHPTSLPLDALGLLPTSPDWAGGLRETWSPGEVSAHRRLDRFLAEVAASYAEDRNRPDLEGTSRLSPHLHHGEISAAHCWHRALTLEAQAKSEAARVSLETFRKELVWREFSYHLLFNWPTLPEAPFNPAFGAFPWAEAPADIKAWQRGRTGLPIVDAGMRQLWQTGWMHNRVRMIVGSFLVKNLLVPWQTGEAWFWDTLVDADLAANAASWQWVAGSGADAAPYFRIFNPVKQGETFDPDGAYVRRFVPELDRLPARHIHAPWIAPAPVLAAAGVRLGENYPQPIVDLGQTRTRALAAYEHVKGGG